MDNKLYSLNDALYAAYLNNPTIQAARSQLKSTYEKLNQAYVRWKSYVSGSLSLDTANIKGSVLGSDTDGSNEHSISFALTQLLYQR